MPMAVSNMELCLSSVDEAKYLLQVTPCHGLFLLNHSEAFAVVGGQGYIVSSYRLQVVVTRAEITDAQAVACSS